jgi:hypothetical protein
MNANANNDAPTRQASEPKLYKVTDQTGLVTLVQAKTLQAARNHVAERVLHVTRPSALDALQLKIANPKLQIEIAGEEADGQQNLPGTESQP